MNSVETVTAYNQWHEKHDVDESADAPWHLLVQENLRADLDLQGKRILEIGCGRGGFASWLSNHQSKPAEIVAADFSPAAVEKGRAFAKLRGFTGIRWEVRNIQDLGGPGNEFDTVISFETIEHVPEPALAVKELGRVLKPGGRLYLTTPNYMSSIGLLRAYLYLRGRKFDEGGQPICQVNMLPWTRAWVKQAGLRVIKTASAGNYLPFPGRPPIRLKWAEHPALLMKWFCLHSMVIGEKAKPTDIATR